MFVTGFICAAPGENEKRHLREAEQSRDYVWLEQLRSKTAFPMASSDQCGGLPFWDSYRRFHDRTEIRTLAIGSLLGTIVLDGVLFVVYKAFGKERQPEKGVDKPDAE